MTKLLSKQELTNLLNMKSDWEKASDYMNKCVEQIVQKFNDECKKRLENNELKLDSGSTICISIILQKWFEEECSKYHNILIGKIRDTFIDAGYLIKSCQYEDYYLLTVVHL